MTGHGTAVAPRADSVLGLDLTVRRDGLHLAVRGTLDAAGNHRLRRAISLLERSPRGGTIDLSGVEHATRGGLAPLRDGGDRGATNVLVTALGTATTETARALGLPTCTPLRLIDWQVQ